MTSMPERESRLPVGSSASTMRRLRHERARDGDALLLAAGELVRQVSEPVAEAHALERLARTAGPLAPADTPRRRAEARRWPAPSSATSRLNDWKTNPMRLFRTAASSFGAMCADVLALDDDRAVGRRVEHADDVHQRRLARAGRAP